jgi:hypothetical protein
MCLVVLFPSQAYVSLLSPVFTFIILMFGSGVTLAEERYNKRHGKDQWYLDYRARTSPLIPVPPVIYENLPQSVKMIFFFEVRPPCERRGEVIWQVDHHMQ